MIKAVLRLMIATPSRDRPGDVAVKDKRKGAPIHSTQVEPNADFGLGRTYLDFIRHGRTHRRQAPRCIRHRKRDGGPNAGVMASSRKERPVGCATGLSPYV